MNKIKICISIIIIILVITSFYCVIKFLSTKEEIKVASSFDNSVIENIIAENLSEKIIIDTLEDIKVIENQESENNQDNINDKVEEESKLADTKEIKGETSSQSSSNSQVTIRTTENEPIQVNQEVITETQIVETEPTPIVVSTQIQETKEPEVTEEKQEIVIQTSQNINIEKEEKVESYMSVQNTEEYRINNTLTSTIIDIINNNPSQTMIQYGYTVILDESIIALTNPFTFSEQRIKNKIQNKAGTIKLYVRDYYLNGTYIETQCYIF